MSYNEHYSPRGKILPQDRREDEISFGALTLYVVTGMAFLKLLQVAYIFAWAAV